MKTMESYLLQRVTEIENNEVNPARSIDMVIRNSLKTGVKLSFNWIEFINLRNDMKANLSQVQKIKEQVAMRERLEGQFRRREQGITSLGDLLYGALHKQDYAPIERTPIQIQDDSERN